MRRWAAAFLTSLSITIGTFVLLFVSSEFSEGSIIGTVLAYAAFIPYAPIGLILNAIFSGPDHTGIVLKVTFALMLLFYTIVSWLVLAVRDSVRRQSI